MGGQPVAESTPRVNFELLQRYMNKRVLLVGQVILCPTFIACCVLYCSALRTGTSASDNTSRKV